MSTRTNRFRAGAAVDRPADLAEFGQSSVHIATFSGKLSPLMMNSEDQIRIDPQHTPEQGERPAATPAGSSKSSEVGGREGPEPTRFGDWELRGRCIDF
jgi:hypothetical protein